jgi:hypothetical protein
MAGKGAAVMERCTGDVGHRPVVGIGNNQLRSRKQSGAGLLEEPVKEYFLESATIIQIRKDRSFV